MKHMVSTPSVTRFEWIPPQKMEYLPVRFMYTRHDGTLGPVVLYYRHDVSGPCSFEKHHDKHTVATMIAISGETSGIPENKEDEKLRDKFGKVMLCLPSAEPEFSFNVYILKKGDENHPDRKILLPGKINVEGQTYQSLCADIRTKLRIYLEESNKARQVADQFSAAVRLLTTDRTG